MNTAYLPSRTRWRRAFADVLSRVLFAVFLLGLLLIIAAAEGK